jgi:preprotein translocase subunit YajC
MSSPDLLVWIRPVAATGATLIQSAPASASAPGQAAPATGAAPAGTAQETPAGGGSPPSAVESFFGGSLLVPLIACMAIFYFFMIGPERKQRKKREQMLANLQKGAKVMTTGGLYGSVAQIQDQVVTLQIADGVRVRYALSAIQTVVEDETAEPDKADKKP